MTPEEQITQLRLELEELKTLLYKDNFSALQIFRKDIQFLGKVGFGLTPISQQAAIIFPKVPGATYLQSEAASAKTAIDAIRAVLIAYGFTL